MVTVSVYQSQTAVAQMHSRTALDQQFYKPDVQPKVKNTEL